MPLLPPQELPVMPSSEEILATTQRLNEDHCDLINDIVRNVNLSTAGFSNVLRPIVDMENLQCGQRHVIAALRYASPDLSTQHAVEEAEMADLAYQASIYKRRELFELVQAVKARHETLDDEDNRLLEKFLLSFAKSGFGRLDEEQSQEWHNTTLEIEKLCTEFNRNIREYEDGPNFTRDELSGISASDLDRFTRAGDGIYYVPIRRNELLTVLRFASVPATRKRMQRAWGEHLSENIPLFKQAAILRDRNARLLGYGSHAESVIPDRMASSVQWVEQLLQDLANHLEPAARKEYAAIRIKKHQHLSMTLDPGTSIEHIQVEPWDVLYYRRMLEDDLAIDHDQIKEYFPLVHTYHAMLGLFTTYFQIRFEEVPQEDLPDHVWADDVSVWAVWDDKTDSDQSFIGYLYADLLDRPNKYKGNQAVRLQPGYLKTSGERVYPVCTIMCSFQTHASDSCPLLAHSQLRTLFHELGHCMHDLLSRTKYQQFHGYNVCLEFGEAIGIMLENWVWMEDVLCSLSCHYTRLDTKFSAEWKSKHPGKDMPPEKIPVDLLTPLLESSRSTRAIQHLQQICDSMFDLTMHNPPSHSALEGLDGAELYKTLQERLLLVERPELGYLHTCHAHLMSGMDAGYYAYISANVFAEELFQEAFSKEPHSKTAWDRFRREVLEYGGSLDEHEILRRFLGREPTVSALLNRLGIEQD